MTSGLGSICSIQNTPSRVALSSSTRRATSAPSSGVSARARAEHELRARVERACAASSRYWTPFWRVIRPTKTTRRLVRVDPVAARARRCPGPACTRRCRSRCRSRGRARGRSPDRRAGCRAWCRWRPRSRRRRSPARSARRSSRAGSRRRAAPPSTAAAARASARSRRAGCPTRSLARWPPKFAYHVWLWAMSASCAPAAIVRSIETARSAASSGASPPSASQAVCGTSPVPHACTVTSSNARSSRARYSTCTPAPP